MVNVLSENHKWGGGVHLNIVGKTVNVFNVKRSGTHN